LASPAYHQNIENGTDWPHLRQLGVTTYGSIVDSHRSLMPIAASAVRQGVGEDVDRLAELGRCLAMVSSRTFVALAAMAASLLQRC
jgi:hypothetical protein